MKKIALIDLKKQQNIIREQIDVALCRVLDGANFIMGREVSGFESEISKFTGAKYAISCASGTDALVLSLMSLNLKRNEAVILPSFTFAATAEAVALLGGIPIFVDVEKDTFNISFSDIERAYEEATNKGVVVKGIIAVDLFGQPADYDAIEHFARNNGLWIVADAAQSVGGTYKGRNVGKFGDCTATSFFPSKPLGCYGDGGCVFTDNDKLAEKMRSLRIHGKGVDKYDNVRIGLNSRLDTMQAAILIEKLKIFENEIELRNKVARTYSNKLGPSINTPVIMDATTSSWAQYTIALDEHADRTNVMNMLREAGISTAVYYPKPLHKQTVYSDFHDGSVLPNTEYLCDRVLSLPMYPYLDEGDQEYVIENVLKILSK